MVRVRELNKKIWLVMLCMMMIASSFLSTAAFAFEQDKPLVETDDSVDETELLGNEGFVLSENFVDEELIKMDKEAARDSRRLIVSYKSGVPKQSIIPMEYRSKVIKQENISDYVQTISVVEGADVEKFKTVLEKNTHVECVDVDEFVKLESEEEIVVAANPNDPHFDKQWWLDDINAPEAWKNYKPQQGKEVVVAVIGTGCAMNHQDLKGRIAPGAKNFSDSTEPGVKDINGSGTFYAGLIAANTNNQVGVASVCKNYNVKILPIKAINDDLTANMSDIIAAIDYAVSKNVDVINVSCYAWYFCSLSMKQACIRAYGASITVVAPIKYPRGFFPGSLQQVIGVSGYCANHDLIMPRMFNRYIEITAPGGDVFSILPNNKYGYTTSASAASSIVAGACAMLKLQDTSRTPNEIRALLGITATDYGEQGFDCYYGYGALNMEKALASPEVQLVSLDKQVIENKDSFTTTIVTNKTVTGITVKLNGKVQAKITKASKVTDDTLEWTFTKQLINEGVYTYRFEAENKPSSYKLKRVTVTVPNGKMPTVSPITIGPAHINEPKDVSWEHSVDGCTYYVHLFKGNKKLKSWAVKDKKEFKIPYVYIKTTGYYKVRIQAKKQGYYDSDISQKMFKATVGPATINNVTVVPKSPVTLDVVDFAIETSKSVTGIVVKRNGKVQSGFKVKRIDKGTHYQWTLSKEHIFASTYSYTFEAKNNSTSSKTAEVEVTAPNGQTLPVYSIKRNVVRIGWDAKLEWSNDSDDGNGGVYFIKLYHGDKAIKKFQSSEKSFTIPGEYFKVADEYRVEITAVAPGYIESKVESQSTKIINVLPKTPLSKPRIVYSESYLFNDYVDGVYYKYLYYFKWTRTSPHAKYYKWKISGWPVWEVHDGLAIAIVSNTNYSGKQFKVFASHPNYANSPISSAAIVYKGKLSSSEQTTELGDYTIIVDPEE